MEYTGFNKIKQAFRPPPSTQLCIYINDPFTRLINNTKLNTLVILCIYLAIFLGFKLIVNAINGTLVSDTLHYDFVSDLTVFPPFNLAVKVAGKLFHEGVHESVSPQSLPSTSTVRIPYLRDYVDITLMIIASLHMTLVHRQWLRISGALSRLWEGKILNPDIFTKKEYGEIVKEGNLYFGQKRWNYLALAIAGAGVLFVLLCFANWGMYSGLSRTIENADKPWEVLAYAGWWSNPTTYGWIPFLCNVGLWFGFTYYMIYHVFIGYGTFKIVRKMTTKYIKGTGKSLIRPQPYHFDGFYGLNVIKVIMYHVYLSLLMNGFALLMMYYYLPSQIVFVMLPFVLIYTFSIVCFVAFPLFWFHRDLRHAKDTALTDIYINMAAIESEISRSQSVAHSSANFTNKLFPHLQLLYYADKHQKALETPTSLFPIWGSFLQAISYLIPVLSILVPLYR
jgi:hypothetical protein